METASSACTPQTRRNFTTVNRHLSSPKNQNTQFLHNFPKFTKSPQTGRNYTTRPPPCQVFFTDPSNLHIIFTNPAIELMFAPHRSSCAASLYGHLLQNWPIRRTWLEPVYTGSLYRTSSIRPLPLELAGAREGARIQCYTKIFARNGHFQIKKVRYEI